MQGQSNPDSYASSIRTKREQKRSGWICSRNWKEGRWCHWNKWTPSTSRIKRRRSTCSASCSKDDHHFIFILANIYIVRSWFEHYFTCVKCDNVFLVNIQSNLTHKRPIKAYLIHMELTLKQISVAAVESTYKLLYGLS